MFDSGHLPAQISPESVILSLETILASRGFVNSPQLSRFLRYTVEQTLQGNADRLKEHQIGTDVFGRSATFDSRSDPVVRVQARQLRFKLADYYAGPGHRDELIISLPKGGYLAEFAFRPARPSASEAEIEEPSVAIEPAISEEPPVMSAPARKRYPLLWWTAAAVTVVGAITIALVLVHKESRWQPTNLEARDLYLRGRFYWSKRTPGDLAKSVELFKQAAAKDPTFSEAYVGLADAYNLLSEFSDMPYKEAFGRAEAAATRAVQLDDHSAEAHNALAFATFYGAFDPVGAEREFKRALSLNPSYATAHHWYATFLFTRGRSREALTQINEAQNLDPGSVSIVADKDLILSSIGRTAEAMNSLKQLEISEPQFYSTHWYLAEIYLDREDWPAYLQELRQAGAATKDAEVIALADAGAIGYSRDGKKGMLQGMLALEEEHPAIGHARLYDLAVLCSLLGNRGKAIYYLQKSWDEREPAILRLAHDPKLSPLQLQPEYKRLTEYVG